MIIRNLCGRRIVKTCNFNNLCLLVFNLFEQSAEISQRFKQIAEKFQAIFKHLILVMSFAFLQYFCSQILRRSSQLPFNVILSMNFPSVNLCECRKIFCFDVSHFSLPLIPICFSSMIITPTIGTFLQNQHFKQKIFSNGIKF